MTVEDVARTGVLTAPPDQSVGNLATVMKEENVGSVVIVDDDDSPVGIVTDRDLVLNVLEPREDPSQVTAGDVMADALVTVDPDRGVLDAIEIMHEHSVRRLPIVDSAGAMAGIVTLDDLVRLLAEELETLAEIVESESPPY